MDVSVATVLDYYTKLTRNYDNGNLLQPEVILPPVPEVVQSSTTVPSPQEYLLPSVVLWDPRQQLDCFVNGIECPFDGHSDDEVCFLEPKRSRQGDFCWQAGARLALMPRLLCSSNWPTVLLSRIYHCDSKIKHRTYIAHDAEILSKIPSSESHKIPFVLLHRTGYTIELGETVSTLLASGMSLVDIAQVIHQQHANNFAQCKAKFEEDKLVCLQNSSQEVSQDSVTFPDYKPVGIPSMEMILESLLNNFQELKLYYTQRMSELSAEILHMGHFFKPRQQMGTLGADGKKWVPMYGYVFAIMNEKGQVLAWQVTKDKSINDVAVLLENVHQRLVKQGINVKCILMPECCKNMEFVKSIFGQNVDVKMDPTFAHQRLEKRLKIRKEDCDYAINCLEDFTLVFNKSTDLSSERKEETAPYDIILDNFNSFMSQWKMKRGGSNERLLHDPALRELDAIKQSIIKGCLSDIPSNSGANYVNELREFLEPVLSKRFLNTELAVPSITVLFYLWNENHDNSDCFVPITSYKASLDTSGFTSTSEKFGCVDVELDSENKENELAVLSSTQEMFSPQLFQLLWQVASNDECSLSRNNESLTAGASDGTLTPVMLAKIVLQVENCCVVQQNLKALSFGHPWPVSIWNYCVLPCCTHLFSRSNYKVKEDDSKLHETLDECGGAVINLQCNDGFFSALSHSIQTLLTSLESESSGELQQVKEHLDSIGYSVDELKNEEEKVTVLRQLISCEWLQNSERYSQLLVSPLLSFIQEAELFKHKGYSQVEMINLLPIAATRVLQIPLIIFTSMEHFPVVPIMLAEKPLTSKCLYMAYSVTGSGCYYAITITPQPNTQQEKPKHVCRCGLGKSKNKHERQFCVQIPGKYLSRCECFRNGEMCNYLCRCFNCGNPKGTSTESRASHTSQKTRVRTKHKLQLKKEFINLPKDEEDLKSSWSENECLAVMFLIWALQYSHSLTSISEIIPETLLKEYHNLLHFTQGQIVLRKKSLDDIKEHMIIASRSLSRFVLLYRKQMDKHWGEVCDQVHLDIADNNQLVVIVESSE